MLIRPALFVFRAAVCISFTGVGCLTKAIGKGKADPPWISCTGRKSTHMADPNGLGAEIKRVEQIIYIQTEAALSV